MYFHLSMFLKNVSKIWSSSPHHLVVDTLPNFHCLHQRWIPSINNNFHVIKQKTLIFNGIVHSSDSHQPIKQYSPLAKFIILLPPLTVMLFEKRWALFKMWDQPKMKLIHFVIKWIIFYQYFYFQYVTL